MRRPDDTFNHYRPQAGEPAPPHRHPLLLGLAAAGMVVAAAGGFVAVELVAAGAAVGATGVLEFVLAPSPITAHWASGGH